MKTLISAAIAGLCLSAFAPLAVANAQINSKIAAPDGPVTCCTPQGCGVCLP